MSVGWHGGGLASREHVIVASISVVIPCYKCEGTIVRALQSVLRQSLRPAEVILVEDCSGDGTLAVLRELEATYMGWVVVVPHEVNRGAAAARNTGWRRAGAEFVAFLDADDAWAISKLALQHAWMVENPNIAISAHGSRVLLGEALPLESEVVAEFIRVSIPRLLFSNFLPMRSVMLRREIVQRFNESFRCAEDYNLWLSCGLSGLGIAYSSTVLAFSFKADYGAGGLSRNLWLMERSELKSYKSLRRDGLIGPLQWLIVCTWSISKYILRSLRVRLGG